jgi:hypothetical protein
MRAQEGSWRTRSGREAIAAGMARAKAAKAEAKKG